MAPYKAGDIIMRCEPFDGGLGDQQKGRPMCFGCYRSNVRLFLEEAVVLKHCKACRQVSYCSKECQKRHWNAIHRYECKYRARADADPWLKTHLAMLDNSFHALVRCILRLEQADKLKKRGMLSVEEDRQVKLADRFRRLNSQLAGYKESSDRDPEFSFAECLNDVEQSIIRRYLSGNEYIKTLRDEDIAELWYRMLYYRKFVEGALVRWKVICVEVAELQHSCDSNATVVMREDGFVYVIADGQIESDTDIRISLVGRGLRECRRDTLRREFFIDCRCAMCEALTSTTGVTRDDIIRSIRCWKAFQEGFDACIAPLPMNEANRPAASFCANGHKQEYSETLLETYGTALASYDGLLMSDEPMSASDIIASFHVLVLYWHPIQAIGEPFRIFEWESQFASRTYIKEELRLVWSVSGMASVFGGLNGQLTKSLSYADFGRGQVLTFLLIILSEALTRTPFSGVSLKRGTAEAWKEVFKAVLPIAERYLGVDARRTQAIRRAVATPYEELAEFAKEYQK